MKRKEEGRNDRRGVGVKRRGKKRKRKKKKV